MLGRVTMKVFFKGLSILSLLVFLLMVFWVIPTINESRLRTKLSPLFEEFKGVTTVKYPNKVEREAAFARVLAEKDRVVRESTWPLITCRATFTARNPGTIHRKDVRSTLCFWGKVSD